MKFFFVTIHDWMRQKAIFRNPYRCARRDTLQTLFSLSVCFLRLTSLRTVSVSCCCGVGGTWDKRTSQERGSGSSGMKTLAGPHSWLCPDMGMMRVQMLMTLDNNLRSRVQRTHLAPFGILHEKDFLGRSDSISWFSFGRNVFQRAHVTRTLALAYAGCTRDYD